MIHEKSEDISFRVSWVEKIIKRMVKTLHFYNMEKKLEESMETNMGNMEKKMEKLEESMERIVNLIQHSEEKSPNDDNVVQGTHDERNSSHFD